MKPITKEVVLDVIGACIDADPSILEAIDGMLEGYEDGLEKAADQSIEHAIRVCETVAKAATRAEFAAGAQTCVTMLRDWQKTVREKESVAS